MRFAGPVAMDAGRFVSKAATHADNQGNNCNVFSLRAYKTHRGSGMSITHTKHFRWPPRWALGAWAAYGLLSAVISHFVSSTGARPISWGHAIALNGVFACCAAAISPAAFLLAERLRIEPPHRFRNVCIHAVAAIGFSFVVNVAFQLGATGLGIYRLPQSFSYEMRALVSGLSDGAPIYGVIVFVHYAGYYLRKYEASAAKAADLNAQRGVLPLPSYGTGASRSGCPVLFAGRVGTPNPGENE